ncbi:hypothetical protein V8C40DRAFT_261545 [Trichoderma camerunense]
MDLDLSHVIVDGLEGFLYTLLVAFMFYILGICVEPFVYLVVMALRRPNGEGWQYFRNGFGNAFADAAAEYKRFLFRIAGRVEDDEQVYS